MKKSLLIVTAMLVASIASAQWYYSAGITANRSELKQSEFEKPALGLGAGIGVSKKISWFEPSAGIRYTRVNNDELRIRNNYISGQLLVGVHLPTNSEVDHVIISAGPQLRTHAERLDTKSGFTASAKFRSPRIAFSIQYDMYDDVDILSLGFDYIFHW